MRHYILVGQHIYLLKQTNIVIPIKKNKVIILVRDIKKTYNCIFLIQDINTGKEFDSKMSIASLE
jgi:hypothetical protein